MEQESGEGSPNAFEVKVTFAPIAIAIASPQDRLLTDDLAAGLVKRTLDEGNRQELAIQVTSDGAVKAGGVLIDRVYPLVAAG